VISCGRYRVLVIDVDSGAGPVLNGHRQVADVFYAGVQSVCFSSDGSRLLTGATDGEVVVWSTESWREVGRLVGHSSAVRSIDATADLRTLVTSAAAADATVRIWVRAS